MEHRFAIGARVLRLKGVEPVTYRRPHTVYVVDAYDDRLAPLVGYTIRPELPQPRNRLPRYCREDYLAPAEDR